MLSAREIEEKVAAALEQPAVTVIHVARILREARQGLWPNPGSGRRRPRLEPRHAANIMVAAEAGPPASGPSTVARYGSLRLEAIYRTSFDSEGREQTDQEFWGGKLEHAVYLGTYLIPVAGSLIDTMTTYIEGFAQSTAGDFIEKLPFSVQIELNEHNPRATVQVADGPRRYSAVYLPPEAFLPAESAEAAHSRPEAEPAITRTVTFWPAVFRRMAEICKTTATPVSKPAPHASAGAENESAALPGAAPSDQSATSAAMHRLPGTENTPENTVRERDTQADSDSWAGLCQLQPEKPHARYRTKKSAIRPPDHAPASAA